MNKGVKNDCFMKAYRQVPLLANQQWHLASRVTQLTTKFMLFWNFPFSKCPELVGGYNLPFLISVRIIHVVLLFSFDLLACHIGIGQCYRKNHHR